MKRERYSYTMQLAAVGCALLLPLIARADTAPLAADAYINPGSALAFGGLPTLNIGGATNSQGLIQFDLTQWVGIPGSKVASARLHFYVNKVTAAGAVDIALANAAWIEATVSGVGGPAPGAPVATESLSVSQAIHG